jgi:hypothetical protein
MEKTMPRAIPVLMALAAISSTPHTAPAQTLQEQQVCATKAKKYFLEQAGQAVSADYESHYNTKLRKCLVLIHLVKVTGPFTSIIRQVSDVFERHIYGDYLWQSQSGKKYWEVEPITCEVTPTLALRRRCRSREEFDAMISDFMTD